MTALTGLQGLTLFLVFFTFYLLLESMHTVCVAAWKRAAITSNTCCNTATGTCLI